MFLDGPCQNILYIIYTIFYIYNIYIYIFFNIYILYTIYTIYIYKYFIYYIYSQNILVNISIGCVVIRLVHVVSRSSAIEVL